MPVNNHYDDPIELGPHVGGNSRNGGDVSPQVREQVIQEIINEAHQWGLSDQDIANLLAIADSESRFNPDAASNISISSASGTFEVTDSTAQDLIDRAGAGYSPRGYQLPLGYEYDRFDIQSGIEMGIFAYLDKQRLAGGEDALIEDIYKMYNPDATPAELERIQRLSERYFDSLPLIEEPLLMFGPDGNGALTALEGWHNAFQQAEGSMGSPIVLDLDGNGIQATPGSLRSAFDLDANGFAESTGWVGKDDGLLVWDRNGDGQINNGRELFGNATLLADGSLAQNGFQALAELDSNGDGVIDANDAVFANIKIWKDINGDGFSSADELLSLADAGVQSISVGYNASSLVDANSNEHHQLGSFTRTDGTTGAADDVWFKRDLIDTVAEEWLPIPADIAVLPDLRGYGNVYDLHQAMVRDASGELKSLVQSFAAETDVQARNALFEEIVFKWTGVGPYWWHPNIQDGRQVEVLEKLFGESYVSPQFGYHQITTTGGTLLSQAYQGAFEMFYGQLMAQTHLKEDFDRVTYTWDSATQSLKGDLTAVGAYLDSQLQVNPESGKTEVDEFARSVHGLKAEAMLPFNTLHGSDRLTWLVESDGMQRAEGTDGADTLTASSNPFAVWAGAGDDLIQSGSTNDLLYGNEGNDTIVDTGGSNTIY